MYGTREQIDASGPLRHIPSTFQKLQIPGKTGRFTGDIEDFLRPKSNDFLKRLRMYAIPRWIKDNEIRYLIQLIHYFQYVSRPEVTVVKLI